MASSLLSDVSLRVRITFFALTMGAVFVPMVFIALFAKREEIQPSMVFGCYAAPGAPPLEIGLSTIRIVEPGARRLSYEPQQSKTSYQLSVRPALRPKLQADGKYHFEQARGIGYFWSLLPEEGKNRNRIRHPREYSGRFEVYASDGTRLVYVRQATTKLCR
ncbi:hypothetical protein [Novosphingobium sp. MMS21-SN21R]|uniref:hypothetical protein n=1 Tax=Novosphingobium sp. MMS21-SN21R TaxID=2969298 RepID=UPI00288410A9|nr:hypothetical protein [Novosphingobium sp. MMS21-SN21R]MDT0507636.1 hypothetical protein [Novosphingobium sp. MMS21-SN21R]